MNKKERIESLRKEKTTQEFIQKGIANNLYDFKFRFKKEINEYLSSELESTVLNSLTNQLRKKIEALPTFNEIQQFVNELSFGQYQVVITPLDLHSDDSSVNEQNSHMIELLGSCAKLSKDKRYPLEHAAIPYFPIKIEKIKKGKSVHIGYSLVHHKIGKKYHGYAWRLKKFHHSSHGTIYDFASVIALMFYWNILERFILNNEDLIRFHVTKHLFSTYRKSENSLLVSIPMETKFAKELIQEYRKYHLIDKEPMFIKNPSMDSYESVFYLYKNEHNHIENLDMDLLRDIALRELLYQMDYIKDKVDRKIQQQSDYARSFQTKKHINKSTLEVMKNNEFLKNYQFVELDNEVDLDKFRALEQDFVQFKEIFPVPYAHAHSLRIKKLGQHRAAGLYYPAPIRATLFDLDSPDSYIHELGHQIDYTFTNEEQMLSESINFRPIVDLYKEKVESAMQMIPQEDPFLQQWQGKSKYNRSYYFQPTEVFARSFELYLHQKGVQNSFLKDNYQGVIYPKDKEYLKQIELYFDSLVTELKDKTLETFPFQEEVKHEEDGVASEPTVENTNITVDPSLLEQLTLF